jgi:tetratricopeptide (TPR) repeat protein
MESMKREIDVLQKAALGRNKPWYKQVSVLVSILALLFSFGTTAVSLKRADRQDVHDYRAELRGLIQRIVAIDRANTNISQASTQANNAQALSASNNQEKLVLAKQAAELIEQIPSAVTGLEYHAVSFALANSGEHEEALRMAREGLSVARGAIERDWLLRQYGSVQYALDRTRQGRRAYRQALNVFREDPGHADFFKAWQRGTTALEWALTEMGLGNCVEAKRHIDQARRYATKNSALDQQISATVAIYSSYCGAGTASITE